jgi:hypothetical protein
VEQKPPAALAPLTPFTPPSAAKPAAAAAAPTSPAVPASDPTERAAQVLALLQRDGRLIDFLLEDIASYSDAQIGAAVRDVHAGCKQTLSRYMTISPAIDADEGREFAVDASLDPAKVKVIGNVAGQPPLRGVVRHRGWLVSRLDLPPLPSHGRMVIAPAEVEVP